MKHWNNIVAITVLVLASACSKSNRPEGEGETPGTRFISIGTGGATGVYYRVGGALMELLNRDVAEHGIKASFQATGGSVYNVNAVLTGDLDFGLAQSDRQFQAVHGTAEWSAAGPQERLRAVCSIHPEAVTLVAAVDAEIMNLHDLRGKRVNIGNPGSGHRGNAVQILESAGIDWETTLHAEGVKAAEASKLLQDGRIDAFFYTVGHPAGAIMEAAAGRRRVRLIPLTGLERLLRQYPYYAETVIPVTLYPSAANQTDVPTVGVVTTLITSADVADDVVYTVARTLFDRLDEFKAMHPAFEHLDARRMVKDGISAPFHPGAERCLRELGLLP